ncbi:MAG TPA: hypothetical protein VHK91_01740 [Flavisolibacter sp.]|jgi:uncharacterized damage-inducible protein DinB|nr:hypothetical protein [Flavisolibacter sp.]
MQLFNSIKIILEELKDALTDLPQLTYTQPSGMLFQATIGQHVRHVIELFLALENGYKTGIVNYEKRKREILIETDKDVAIDILDRIIINLNKEDKILALEGHYDIATETDLQIASNYYRELLYNMEHAIHHMALIRVGFKELTTIQLPDTFGVAPSTTKYKLSCAR